MRKLFLPLLFVAISVSCIDKDYDLSKVNTDNTTIGDVLRFPLASITIGMKDISKGGSNIEAIFREADLWLPSPLPDKDGAGNEYLDLTRISDQSYTNTLTDALITQMLNDPEKFEAVTDLICSDYKSYFTELLHLPADVDVAIFRPLFIAEFSRQPILQNEARKIAHDYLGKISIEDMRYKVDRIGLSNEIIDMLAKNLDATTQPKPSLHLYGQIRSKLPVSLTLRPSFTPSSLSFGIGVDATKPVNQIAESNDTQLSEQDLRQIVNGIEIVIPVTLEKYYPHIDFHPEIPEQIVIDLMLVKRGGLKLDL